MGSDEVDGVGGVGSSENGRLAERAGVGSPRELEVIPGIMTVTTRRILRLFWGIPIFSLIASPAQLQMAENGWTEREDVLRHTATAGPSRPRVNGGLNHERPIESIESQPKA